MRVTNGYTAKICLRIAENRLGDLQDIVAREGSMQAYLVKEGFPETEMNELRAAFNRVEQLLGELHMTVSMHEDIKDAEALLLK